MTSKTQMNPNKSPRAPTSLIKKTEDAMSGMLIRGKNKGEDQQSIARKSSREKPKGQPDKRSLSDKVIEQAALIRKLKSNNNYLTMALLDVEAKYKAALKRDVQTKQVIIARKKCENCCSSHETCKSKNFTVNG